MSTAMSKVKKKKHGGKRKGSGRPKLKKSEKKEKTIVMRIPESKVDIVKEVITEDLSRGFIYEMFKRIGSANNCEDSGMVDKTPCN